MSGLSFRSTGARAARVLRAASRACVQPLGYLAFVVALGALSAAARLLGDEHELGFFAGRLNRMIWRYPEVTRHGVQMAWLVWIALFALAISPFDPITSRWDEVLLAALAAAVLWRRMIVGRRVGR
jgi:dolichol kinase